MTFGPAKHEKSVGIIGVKCLLTLIALPVDK